jgi:acetyltransferase-like isoleucine patch superfamily enzyme
MIFFHSKEKLYKLHTWLFTSDSSIQWETAVWYGLNTNMEDMKMKTNYFCFALVIGLVFFASCENTKDFGFEEIDGKIIITEYLGSGGNVKIPNMIKRMSVSSIGNEAFKDKQLTSIIIPDSVLNIGDNAFQDNQLTSIVIPDSVTTIGNEAFKNNLLTGVTISANLTEIGDNAFQDNQLTSITIPNSVTTIGSEAFKNNLLTSIVIPDGITEIGDMVFMNNQLTNIRIPGSVTSINISAFSDNPLTDISIAPENTVYSTNGPFLFIDNGRQIIMYFGTETSISIPNGVTIIGDNVFSNRQITSVTIPNSVTAIGEGAFRDNQITRVVFPNSVRNIGINAFAGNRLDRITIGANVNLGTGALDPVFDREYYRTPRWDVMWDFAFNRGADVYIREGEGWTNSAIRAIGSQ